MRFILPELVELGGPDFSGSLIPGRPVGRGTERELHSRSPACSLDEIMGKLNPRRVANYGEEDGRLRTTNEERSKWDKSYDFIHLLLFCSR